MRVADYIFKTLADRGFRHAFLVTGGGAMHLNDALRLEKRMTPVCCHHEQACAIAAEGYYRASGRMPVVTVTTGPGGTNALTGVIGAWQDSIPMLVISGQVKFSTTVASCPEVGLRQLGDQELNIVDVVRPITKYAKLVLDPLTIGEELDKALEIACSGRPGPVWLDIPLNVQGAVLPADYAYARPLRNDVSKDLNLSGVMGLLKSAKRPVFIGGHGIELDGAVDAFRTLVEKYEIPTLTTFNGMNVLPSDHALNFGRIGTLGQRSANFILQNADLIITIGTRNNVRQVSYNWENFAKRAKKVVVDIDPAELAKPTVRPDLPIAVSASEFINGMLKEAVEKNWEPWIDWCRVRRTTFPVHTREQMACEGGINPYHFMHVLTDVCSPDIDIVAGNGTACVALLQTGVAKSGQKIFWNSGCASMGYDIPAAVGAAVATGRQTVCLAGDGSAMMNLQELETITYRKLPVKIFILANDGYSSIRQTQSNLFSKELMGCDPSSGVGIPDFTKVADAFGIPSLVMDCHEGLERKIKSFLAVDGPALAVVKIPSSLGFAPKLSARRNPDGSMVSPSLEDMSPFLEKSVVEANMIKDSAS